MKSIASKGIDVSVYQGRAIPWKQLKADGITWAYIRSSCGLSVDAECRKNILEASDAGIPWLGVYHFMHELSPASQVEAIKRGVGDAQSRLTLPVAIDAESKPASTIKAYADSVLAFEQSLLAYGLGHSVLYTYESFLRTFEAAGVASQLQHLPTWVAKYPGANLAKGVPVEGAWKVYAWQYDGDGGERMPGGVDCDYNLSCLTGYEISCIRDGNFDESKI